MIVKVASALLSFAVAIVLARALGPNGYGVYAFAFAVITLLAIPVQAGLPHLVVRETAKAESMGDWALLNGLWRWANRLGLLLSLGVAGLVAFLVWIAESWIEPDRFQTLVVALLLLPLVALNRIRAAALRGLRRVVIGQLPDSVLRPAGLLGGAGFFVLTEQINTVTPEFAMFLHAVAAGVALGIGTVILRSVEPSGVRCLQEARYESSTWLRAAWPLAMVGGLQLINGHADLIMLGLMRSDDEVGVYRVVVQLGTLVVFGLDAINHVLQPQLAVLNEKGDRHRLQIMVTRSTQAILLFAVIPSIMFIIAGGSILFWCFGEAYTSGSIPLAILAAGQLVNAGMGPVGMLLNMTGHERDTMRGVGVAAVANVVLNIVLIPYYGMEGAAVATALTLVIWNALLARIAYRRINIITLPILLKRSSH